MNAAKQGYSNGRKTLYVIEGEGLGRKNGPVDLGSMLGSVERAEELNCACEILVVPPLTWQRLDNTYIKVQFGNSVMKEIK